MYVPLFGCLVEYLPLKQGLRRSDFPPLFPVLLARRVSSIKTRIKTLCIRVYRCHLHRLVEYLPLKQGLRLGSVTLFRYPSITRRVSSIKTRIF